nr:hypothetical protein [Streptomyces griseoruber]
MPFQFLILGIRIEAQEVGEREHRLGLALGIGVHGGRLHLGRVFQQASMM